MITFSLILCGIVGLFFGSFATVLVTRWHDEKSGIVGGRSECPQCKKTLSWHELIPLGSYILQRGKCRGCRSSISPFYPISEVLMGTIFTLLSYSYIFITGRIFDVGHFILIFLGFITGVYMLYDYLYTEVPDHIMVPGIFFLIILFILLYCFPEYQYIYFDRGTYMSNPVAYILDHLFGGIIVYSFFYLQILIPCIWQFSQKKRWKEVGELFLSYFTFPFVLLISFFKKEERGPTNESTLITWVGGGDLRIALFIGLSLGITHSIAAVFFAYIIGTIISLALMVSQRKIIRSVPFGPFLGIGWFMAIFYYDAILGFIGI